MSTHKTLTLESKLKVIDELRVKWQPEFCRNSKKVQRLAISCVKTGRTESKFDADKISMENYTKGETKKVFDPPLLCMEGAVEMRVSAGSKMRNLLGFALSSMQDENVRHITWYGTANAISKTISCVEILKRKIKDLHQITQIGALRVEDYWEPIKEGLDTLKVNTNIPAISILLSKDPLDTNHPSYQAPGSINVKWAGSAAKRPASGRSQKYAAAIQDVKNAASRSKRPRSDKRPKSGKGQGSKKESTS